MCMDWRAIETIMGPESVYGDPTAHDWQTGTLVSRNSAASIVQLNDINQHAVNLWLCSRYVLMSCFPSPETTKCSGLTPSLNHSHRRIHAR